mgnify:CR=1 FL=1
MRRYLEHFLDLCKNRIFVMLCGVIVLFAIIVLRLFSLQIIHGEYYDESITASVSKTLPVAASAGIFMTATADRLLSIRLHTAYRWTAVLP